MPDDLSSLHFKLGEISGKLDSLVGIRNDLDDLTARVGRLERMVAWVSGAGGVLVGLSSIFGDTIRSKLGI